MRALRLLLKWKFMIDSLIKDVELANYFINEAETKRKWTSVM